MKIITKTILFFSLLTIIACSSDDNNAVNPIQPSVAQRILVINEGNFGQANASISLIEEDSLITNDLIGLANNEISTGDVVQSIYSSNDLIYIISNVENRILVVDSKTFEQVNVIENNLENPRYMSIQNGKIFVTNWGSDFATAFVAVFSENDLSFERKILTDPGTEKIFTNDGQDFWVSNNFTNTVQVFDYDGTEIKETIQVGNSPNGINSFETEALYVLCQDTFGGTEGYLFELSTMNYQKTDSIALNLKPGSQLEIISDPEKKLLFYSGTSTYSINPDNGFSIAEDRLADYSATLSSIYGLGIDNNGSIWLADHQGFTQAGLVIKTNRSNPQETLKSYTVGIGPNGFLFPGF